VAENIAAGVRDVLPDAELEIAPVADGGEGTAEIIGDALGAESISCPAHDALGRAIEARYFWIGQNKTAVMEMSESAGLRRINLAERDPARATTVGAGEMILDAQKRGAREIIIGLGGSATNDGGFGMARALGFRFLRSKDEQQELSDGPRELPQLDHIVAPAEANQKRVIVAADVQNPLLGSRGATRVFAAQKGATPEQIELLEQALTRLADVAARDLGGDYRGTAGAGAAGGLGFGLLTFCGAELRSGFDVVADAIDLTSKVCRAEIVITGEGRLDAQTSEGKAPAGVAKLARAEGKRVYAVVGEALPDAVAEELFDGVFALARPPISRTLAIKLCSQLLRERAAELAAVIRDETCRKTEY